MSLDEKMRLMWDREPTTPGIGSGSDDHGMGQEAPDFSFDFDAGGIFSCKQVQELCMHALCRRVGPVPLCP